MDFHVSVFSNTKHKVTLNGDSPHIKTDIFLDATLLSNSNDFNASSPKDIAKVEEALSNYIKDEVNNYYDKTSKEFKSDISGLGRYAVYQFPTVKDWEEFDWVNKYEQSTFEVNVDVNLNSSYFISPETNYYLRNF